MIETLALYGAVGLIGGSGAMILERCRREDLAAMAKNVTHVALFGGFVWEFMKLMGTFSSFM